MVYVYIFSPNPQIQPSHMNHIAPLLFSQFGKRGEGKVVIIEGNITANVIIALPALLYLRSGVHTHKSSVTSYAPLAPSWQACNSQMS